ncbi:hypothetical protein CVT25_000701 [Psilocybe cyanescens]|uniref:Uncharacterized protein n=1 Tax=Psilocybe cyanescens TaxID=93625 RepID=A0A409WZH9_PSICY|nr:hypothetical protein CVT25_000701 [Psilocybe cyanescens]
MVLQIFPRKTRSSSVPDELKETAASPCERGRILKVADSRSRLLPGAFSTIMDGKIPGTGLSPKAAYIEEGVLKCESLKLKRKPGGISPEPRKGSGERSTPG